jgi:GNAT superfamily N-acetyltransferase
MHAIRPALADDSDAVIAVVRASITLQCVADHRNDADTLARWLANKTPAHFLGWLADHDNRAVVALVDDRVAGVGLLHRSGEIRLFFIAPGMHRQGIGTAIHAALEAHARTCGLQRLHLHSTSSACAFYEALGYRSNGDAEVLFGALRGYPYQKSL